MRNIALFGLLAITATVGVMAEPAQAQCQGGSCGGSASSGGGCGGAPARVGRVDRPTTGARRASPTISAEAMPQWQRPSAEALESAAAEKRPIVVLFPAESDGDTVMSGEDMAELSRNKAVFIRMPFTSDREESAWAVEGVVPVNKLLSDNPARDFNVPVGRSTVVICDWYGNEHDRQASSVRAAALERILGLVETRVDSANARLQKTLERAQEAHEKQDRRTALRHILRNFNDGMVGMPAAEGTARLYRTIMDETRAEIEQLAADGDREALRTLARDLRRTDVEKEINEAISKLS
jgi:hypothetical protein